MATISITDTSALTAEATLADPAALGKSPGTVLHFFQSQIVGALSQPIDQVQLSTLTNGFAYQPAFTLKGGTTTFTAGGAITGSLALYKPWPANSNDPSGSKTPEGASKAPALFLADQFGTAIEPLPRACYLALGFELSLALASTLEPDGTAAPCAYTLTPAAGSQATATLYLPIPPDAAGAYPTLHDALTTLCRRYLLPSTLAQVQALPTGAVFAYDAQGHVDFAAALDLLTVVNPTASPGVCNTYGPIVVKAGPSLGVEARFSLLGEFEVRLWNKNGNQIQLGYYKKQGTSFGVSLKAGAGIDVTAGGFDTFAKIYGLLGSQGTLDPAWLKANVPASVAAEVEQAYQAAVETRLSIALDQECDTTLTDQVAFAWTFHIDALSVEAEAAFTAAIAGDLSRLLGGAALPAGVTKVGSVLDHLKKTRHALTFNFLGLFDYADVQQASLEATARASDDGQLVLADKATLARLSATVTPFVKSDLLRQVLVEDFVATVGYTAALGHLAIDLRVTYTYYQYLHRAKFTDLQLFVEIAQALIPRETVSADWDQSLLGRSASQAASLLASLSYDNATARRLFLTAENTPRAAADYEKLASAALAATPGLELGAPYLQALGNDAQWQKLANAGAVTNFYAALGVDQATPPQWAVTAHTWTVHLQSWAESMHAAAEALAQVLAYSAGKPDLALRTDPVFAQKRTALASQLLAAVDAAPLFHDALGILLIDRTVPPATIAVTVNYAGQSHAYS